jgi:hypothetical protein
MDQSENAQLFFFLYLIFFCKSRFLFFFFHSRSVGVTDASGIVMPCSRVVGFVSRNSNQPSIFCFILSLASEPCSLRIFFGSLLFLLHRSARLCQEEFTVVRGGFP